MERLEILHVPLYVLLGWNPADAPPLHSVLPPTVQEIHFGDFVDSHHIDDWEWTARHARDYLQVYFNSGGSDRLSLKLLILMRFWPRYWPRQPGPTSDWLEADVATASSTLR